MANPVAAIAGVGSSLLGSRSASRSSSRAADAQIQSSREAVAENRRQFEAIQELLRPYVQAGEQSLIEQQNLLGLRGSSAQQNAIDGIEQSPLFNSLVEQGEEAILQNSSATGGLRGGNIQDALAQYRPGILNQLIESQYAKLGGITNVGQSSATGQASFGQQSSNAISNLIQQQGAAAAGNHLAQGQNRANLFGQVGQIAMLGGLGAF